MYLNWKVHERAGHMLLRHGRAGGGVWFVEFELHVGGFGGRLLKSKGVPLRIYKAAHNNKGEKRQKLCTGTVNKTQKQCHGPTRRDEY